MRHSARMMLPAMLLILAGAALSEDVYRDAGSCAYPFLKLDVGAETAALAATSGLARGDLAIFCNPSGLAGGEGTTLTAGHNEWFGSSSQQYIAASFDAGSLRMGISSRMLHASDLERREEATSEPMGTFSVYGMTLGTGAAITLGMFDLGASLEIVREKVWRESSMGVAVNAGATIHPSADLAFTAVVQNVGPAVTMSERSYRLPATWRLGAAYSLDSPVGPLTSKAEVLKPIDNTVRGGAALEVEPLDWLAVRGGYHLNHDSRTFAAGFGISPGPWTLDYAFVPGRYDLGSSHRFTLGRSI